MTQPERATHGTSLRRRIMVALVVIVTVTSSLFATGVVLIKEQLEEIIFDDMVREQLQVLLDQVDKGSEPDMSLLRNWEFHYGVRATSAAPELQALAPGSHHSVRVRERYLQVQVGQHQGAPVYLTYDITEWENLEHALFRLLAFGIALVLLAAIVMGRQASRSILAPVQALTERLSAMQPRQRNVRMAKDFQGNEIGQIAQAFDLYQERLDQFVERERSFTDAASHELRTPLSVMMGAIDVLDTHEHKPPASRALARMKRACGEMRAFIEATLFLSREDSSTILEQQRVNVADVIRGLLEDFQPQLQERGLSVSVSGSEALMMEQPQSIVQIMLTNILRNAIEHTHDGHIMIGVEADCLTIRDTGYGITEDDLPKVFDRNFTTKKDGVGLGLYLVKRICERFEWRITIDSKPGAGTTVTVRF